MYTRIVKLNEAPVSDIEAIQLDISSSLLYTSTNYLNMLHGFLSCDIEIVLAYDEDDRLLGFLPMAYKKGAAGMVVNSLPFYGSNGSMLVATNVVDKNIVRGLLFKSAIERIEQLSFTVATFISNPLDAETNHWLKTNVQNQLLDERIGQITHLPKNSDHLSDDLIKSFEDPRPRNIRKALKEGINIYHSHDQDALNFLYAVHHDNITAINGIPKEKRFFMEIPKYFSEADYRIYIAEYKGEKIGALLLFYYNETVEYFTPAVIEAYRNIQPTALLIFQAMIDAVQNGFKNWNWGGTWLTQGGVYDFKKKWGTTDYHYYYYTIVNDKAILDHSKEYILAEYPYFFVVPFSALKL